MKRVTRLLKGHKHIVFLDFEGTQFTHEMIAIGAVLCSLDKNGNIKKEKDAFKCYVKPKNKIGSFVMKLTGITEEKLKKEGVSFAKAMNMLKSYCGMSFKKATYITFGNHDLKILNMSISYNLDSDKELCSQIQKNYVDFSALISDYIRDPKGNPMSLVNYCKMFNVKEAGEAHDPRVDAINLAHLYDAFLKDKQLVLDEYIKVLAKLNHLPEPVKYAISKLANGEDVNSIEFLEQTRKSLE